ncbi:MAG: ABC transporter permease [Chloroflexota bacterium]
MNSVLAIAQRELKSYFASPVAYVVTGLFLVMSGYLFSAILVQSQEASMRFIMQNLSVIFLFIMPFLTMRLLADEQRTGTIEILLTNPVRDHEVVLGKFLGATVFFTVMLLFTLYYPFLLFTYGNPDRGPILSGYLGLFLQGMAFLAVGLFASSLTQNQIIAAVLTFTVLLVLWLAEAASNILGAPMKDIFRYLSVTSHFQDFPRGIIDTAHIVYFLSLVVGSLFLATLSLQTRRWNG